MKENLLKIKNFRMEVQINIILGKLTEKNTGYYIGEYKNNLKHGKGTYFYHNGIKYVGDYIKGYR